MKKITLVSFTCFMFLFGRSQWTTSGSTIYYTGGNVGIGTSSPATNLEIQNLTAGGLGAVLRLTSNGGTNAQVAIDLGTYNAGSNAPAGRIVATDDGNWSASIAFQTKLPGGATNALQSRMIIFDNGNVGIGTTDTKGYLFAVNGSAIFTSAFVKPNSSWPDYVFGKDYRLSSLDSVSRYIQAHHHLPDMPSADSVQSKGIDLGGTQTALVKKIEELTLYLIEQKKEGEELKDQLKAQQERIEQLEQLIKKKSNN